MLKKMLFALMFAIVATVTHAESDLKTVASKAYVDTQIETKQLKIPAAGQPNVGAGETVMTYTSTGNGQIGERGLYSDISSYDATTDGDKLITASALNATFTNLPTTPTTKLECANESDGCTLWTIVDQTAYTYQLPDGYTRLEYIQSSGTQYIDTGIKGNQNIKVDIDFIVVDNGNFWPFGARTTANTRSFAIWSSTGIIDGAFRVGFDNTSGYTGSNGSAQKNTRFRVVHSKDGTYINDTLVWTASGYSDFATTNNLLAFATYDGTTIQKTAMKLYSLKLWNNGTLVRNFVPVKQGTTVGMYDTVSGQFFTNAATSGPNFTPGPTVN